MVARVRGTSGRARWRSPISRVPADQARAALRALSRLDRVQHAAALVGRHRACCSCSALLEPFDLAQDKPNDLRALHLIAEAGRLAFADRARYVADPAFVPVPTEALISPAYIAERRKLISESHSMGAPGGPVAPGYVERGTSHMTIVDRAGNAVAFTTTIEAPFGAHMMVGGFILNNELTDFSPVSERDGKPVANRVEPGKRPRSSMSPTFVLDRDRKLVLSVGSAGGQRIIGDTFHALVGMLDWNLSAAGRARPAAGRQHERPDRDRGQRRTARAGRRLAQARPSSTSPPA